MDSSDPLVIHAAAHPSTQVDRFGFPLEHPYVEHCLLPILGPSSTVLLRRLPSLWQISQPFETTVGNLGSALGLQSYHLSHTLKRLVKFGFAERPMRGELRVFARCAPLTDRVLGQVPTWVRTMHGRLLDAHIAELLGRGDAPGRSVTEMAEHLDRVAARSQLTETVDQLRQHSRVPAPGLRR